MSLVPSDISPSVTTQRQRQGNVVVVRLNGSIPCKGGERENKPVGKTLTSNNIILTSQIGNRQPDPVEVANGPIRSGLWQGGVRNKFHYATEE
jgi:hypothetical protein